jgi:hypothetical protein
MIATTIMSVNRTLEMLGNNLTTNKMEKIHWKKAFNSDYIGASDLEDYKDIVLTIKEVRLEQLKGTKEKDTKNVAYFVENMKPMILNATNCKAVRKLAGGSNFINDWQNIRATIYVERNVKAFGELTDALRIRSTPPPASQPKADIDVTVAILNLTGCTTQEELKNTYVGLSKEEKTHPKVIEITNKLKAELPND